MQHWSKQLTRVTIASILIGFVFSTVALAGESWRGPGRIARGAGQGGTVPELRLETENQWIIFRSGPDKGKRVQLSAGNSAETGSGTWQVSRTNSQLNVTFYQKDPYRVIQYRLGR
ncbi:MAG: hypothetical protein F6K19_35735 [Cyanothece sp. SIO1E1]|nr:hypothetical protein [Cyanothece sp. SIO1E1]